jgi:GNAT superfamily N-acetyltransferase
MQAYQGAGLMPKLYAHLLKSKVFDSIQSDYLQSFGGKAVWQQLAKEPGIHVFGWHKSTKESFYIEQQDIDEDEVWDTELQDLLEESKKIREELLTEQDEKRREYLLERKEEISESIGGDHGTAQHQDHYEDVTLVAQRSGGKLANRLLNKKASPDFGYSKYNDRDLDINKLEWKTSTRDTARGKQITISANEYSEDWHNPVIKEPSPEGKFSCVAEIRLISHPSYLAVEIAAVFSRRWVGTGVGQMLYDKAIEYAKKKGFKFFCSDNKEHSMTPEAVNAWTTRLSARYNVTFDKEMGRYMIDLQHSSKTASPATTLPQLFYRGTNPGDTRRIRTGNDFWDSLLFVTDDPKKARNYGSQVDTYQFKPEAKVLREHTREFNRLGRWKKGESLLDYCSRLTLAAKEAGYDAVYFTMQGDVGTAVINRDSIEKLSEIKTLSDNVFTDTPDMFEAGAGLKFQVVEVRICDIQDTGWPTNCYKRYAKLMKAGEKFPLILVKKTRNGELTLEDGVHRLAAFKLAFPNEECIPVALFEDSKKERGGDKTAAAVPATTPAFDAWFIGSKVVDAQGNPLRCYHGTRVGEDFDEFSVDGPPLDDYGEPSSSGSGGDPSAYLGAHFSVEPEVASSFALSTVNWMKTRYDGEDQRPRVIPVYLNIKNPKNFGDELNLHSFIYEGKLNGYASEDSLKDAMYANGIQDEDSQEAQDWWNKYDTDVVFRKEQNEWALVNANDESAQEIAQELGSDARSRLEQQGFDGIKYRNRMEGGNAYVVFNPSQVKSAIGNAGTYDPQQNSITAKLKSKLLQPKTAVVPLTHTMYHVSRRRNRASIQKLGLEPRIQEFDDIERKPGIYMLETLAQAQDWAYWFGSGELQIVDIWEITLPKGYRVEPETSKDFTDIYDAWIGYEAIPPANLKLVESMQPDKKGTNPPLTGRTLKVKR